MKDIEDSITYYDLLINSGNFEEYTEFTSLYNLGLDMDFIDIEDFARNTRGVIMFHFFNCQNIRNEEIKKRIGKLLYRGQCPSVRLYTTEPTLLIDNSDNLFVFDGAQVKPVAVNIKK